jgi:hypothetical protein
VKFARPSGGWKVEVKPVVNQTIDSRLDRYPRLRELFNDLVQRLRYTGHRDEESQPVGSDWNRRVFVAAGDVRHGIPRMAVVYTIDVDTIIFEKMLLTDD